MQVFSTMKTPALLIFLLMLPMLKSGGDLQEAIDFYHRGEFKTATDLLKDLKRSSPDDHEIRFWLGKAYIKIRKWGDGVKEMEKAVELEPSNPKYHLWLGRASGFHAEHSSFIRAPFRARRVLKEFLEAKELAPEDLDIRFDLLEYYLQAPGILGGGKDKAEVEAEIISKLDPRKGHTARATIHWRSEDWDRALAELTQATIDYPDEAGSWKDLADYLLYRGDYEGAIDSAQTALELNSESKQSRLLVAASNIRLGQNLQMAAETLQNLIEGTLTDDDPSFEEVHYWLGEYYLASGDKARAREAFKSALDLNPDYSKAKDGISRLK
jgi:tetratricopeptide (TPR) repeat protein